METEYLAFVDEVGRGLDGEYIYELDFTKDIDSLWGEFFNSIPASSVPNLHPDRNYLSSIAKFSCNKRLGLAKTNGCFSLQDCIDGIISLCFSEIDENPLMCEEKVFKLDFGMIFDDVKDIMDKMGLELFDQEEILPDNTAIENLIENLGEENNGQEDLDPEEW